MGGSAFMVVANARAGSAAGAAITEALGVLAHHGPVEVVTTADPAALAAALREAEDRLVVLAGGDGSLHAGLVAARHERAPTRPLGLIPLGTGNDFARGLGLPLDPAGAAQRIVDGTPRPLDLVVDDRGGLVVNAVHAGVGATAAGRADGMKERLGPLAYPLGALLAGVQAEGWDLEIEVDDARLELPGGAVLMVGLGNGPFIGGGTTPLPRGPAR